MSEQRERALLREPPHYNDLHLSLAEAWRLLADGVGNASSAFHQPVLATTALDGAADVRVVVLRGADRDQRQLRFNSDARTGKLAELAKDARAMVVAYDHSSKVQLRLTGLMTVHQADALALATWAETRKYSRHAYRSVQAPGSVLELPQAVDFQATRDIDCGVEHFCVLCFTVTRIEWLYLAAAGHRRARFDWQTDDWQAQWLVP